MEIKTQHKPGDKVWLINYITCYGDNRPRLRIYLAEILSILKYAEGEVTWELEATSKGVAARFTAYDSDCFSSKEELIKSLIEELCQKD